MKARLALLVLGLALVPLSVVLSLKSGRQALGTEPPRCTAVVIDATDSCTMGQRAAEQVAFRRVLEHVQRGELVLVYVIGGPTRPARETWRGVSPGQGKEAQEWREGAAYVASRFRRTFAAPLDSALESGISQPDSARASAIFEDLAEVSGFTDFARCGGARRIVLVSDLIENVPGKFSFYGTPGRSVFKPDTSELLFPDWQANLSGVNVEVQYLLRERYAATQTPALIDAWRVYFAHCGAVDVQFTMLPE